jgi:glycosyltransferase involved in cell wall biosynthesis
MRLKWVWWVDKIIAVAKRIEEGLVRSGVPADKVVTIHGAIDLKRFQPGAPDPAMRREFGLSEDMPVVGKVAGYRPWKGYKVFLEAAAAVLAEEPKVRFFAIGGETSYYEKMLATARRLGIERQVVFTGFREDVERFYPLMTLSVNCATAGEGIPGVLRESLAMGIPVVATDVGGNREVVVDGETGLLIPPGDSKALNGAILRLLRDPALARTLAENGQRRVKGRFSIEAMVEGTEAVYREAAGAPR